MVPESAFDFFILEKKYFLDISKYWNVIVDLWDNYKRYNIHIMRLSKGEERVKGATEDRFEVIMAENFSKLMTDTKPQM